uniref:Late embryogenesis abundant protein LEA-2 subgroup domain-containing protein n=1 Tax=Zea mays TaxID=4577 RepID=A0A804LF06_MAIZE
MVFPPKATADDAMLQWFALAPADPASNSTISFNVTATVSLRNPNMYRAIEYGALAMTFSFNGTRFDDSASVPGFKHKARKTATQSMRVSSVGKPIKLTRPRVGEFRAENDTGSFGVEMRLDTVLQYKGRSHPTSRRRNRRSGQRPPTDRPPSPSVRRGAEAMQEVCLHHALPQALRPPPPHPSRARRGQDGAVVELTVHDRLCDASDRSQADPNQWPAVMQFRQRASCSCASTMPRTLRWVEEEEESEGGRRGCLAEPRGEGERHLQVHNLGETATMSVPHGRQQDLELAIDDFDEELIDPELRFSFQRNSKSIQQTLALLTYRSLFGIAIRLPVMLLRDRHA